MNERLLIVDGPMRGFDVPLPSGRVVAFPIRCPLGDGDFIEARYRIDRIRSHHGEVFYLGFLDNNVEWRVVANIEAARRGGGRGE